MVCFDIDDTIYCDSSEKLAFPSENRQYRQRILEIALESFSDLNRSYIISKS